MILVRVLFAVCLLAWASPGWAAITLGASPVHGVSNAAGSPVTVTYNSLTAGRGMVCAVAVNDTVGTSNSVDSITDGTTSFTLVGTYAFNDNSNWGIQIGYLPAQVAGGNKTITATFTSGNGGSANALLFCAEVYDGVAGGIADDMTGAGSATGNSTAPQSTVTTNTANSAVIGMVMASSADPSVGANYTQLDTWGWFVYEKTSYDLDAGTAGAKTYDWSSGATEWTVAAGAFKAASGGAATPRHLMLMGVGQ